jgi:regulatory protein
MSFLPSNRGGSAARRPARRGGPEAPVPGGAADTTPDADPESVARAIVLRQLTMAPRSRAQLVDKLAQRGAPDDVAGRVLDRFEEVGLVDDAAFAAGWVRSRHQTRGLSRRALAHELRSKGIDEDTAEQALGQLAGEDERRAAEELVARRLRSVRGLPRERQLSRLAGLLARKGYSSGLALSVVREALAGLDDAGPDDADPDDADPDDAGLDDADLDDADPDGADGSIDA